jgi:hypothetical protein
MTTNDSGPTQPAAPPSTVTYAGTQQQITEAIGKAAADVTPASNTAVGQVLTELRARTRADQQANQDAMAQANTLQQQVPTRSGPSTGGAYYLGYSQNELHAMVNNQADPAAVNDQGQSFTNVGNGLVDIADRLHAATTAANTSWHGNAATAAAGFTTSVASWHGATGQGSQLAGNRLWQQSEGLAQARAAMPAPIAQPTPSDLANAITASPSGTWVGPSATVTALVDQYVQAQDNHQQMARVAQQYDNHLGSNSSMPQFTTPTDFAPQPPSTTGTAAGSAQGPGVPVPSMRQAPSTGAPPTTATSPPTPASNGRAGTNSPPGQGGTAGGTSAQPGSTVPTAPGATSAPPGPTVPASTLPAGLPSPVPALGSTGGGSGAAGLGDFSGGQGSPLGALGAGFPLPYGNGGSSARSTVGTGPIEPGTPEQPGEPWAGGRSAAGAAVGQTAAARGVAGAQEVNETPIGQFGAGRGRKDEDEEHERASYLDEPDPNRLFGIEGRLAPRVIGDE